MKCKVVTEIPNEILIGEMKDGDIGIMYSAVYKGLVVQACGNDLIPLGKDRAYSWINKRDTLQVYVHVLKLPFLLEFAKE